LKFFFAKCCQPSTVARCSDKFCNKALVFHNVTVWSI